VDPAAGTLYLVATPIGNLSDVTLRALDTLRSADLIACEDTRVTARLLARHEITGKKLLPFHAHNEHRQAERLIEALGSGLSVALATDAGTPSISDPGYLLAQRARAAGHRVVPIPGPSAILAALAAAGLPCHRFTFVGFLPPRSAARRREIASLAPLDHALIFFESPRRLAALLADLAGILGDRPAAICRELTKLHEEIRVDSLPVLAAQVAKEGPARGELTVVVAPQPRAAAPGAEPEPPDGARLAADYRDLMASGEMDRRAALRELARRTGLPRREVYRLLEGERTPGRRGKPA
jgi:16S rRNA (cytidine1402-2'-O)-methyltransferase